MRPTLTVCRHGLAVAAAAVLLTACGGSGDGGDSASSTTSARASTSSANAADSEFCAKAVDARDRLAAAIVQSQTDLAALPKAIQELDAEAGTVQPPEEIASDWDAFVALIHQAAGEVSSVDITSPNASAVLQAKLGPLLAQLGALNANVSNYLRDNCDVELVPSGSASPTS